MYTVRQRGEQLFYAQLGRQGCSKEGRSCSRYRRGDSAVLSTEAENQLCSVQSTKREARLFFSAQKWEGQSCSKHNKGGKDVLLSTKLGGSELF